MGRRRSSQHGPHGRVLFDGHALTACRLQTVFTVAAENWGRWNAGRRNRLRVWARWGSKECFVVDEQGRPTSGTDELVYEHDPPEILRERLDHELFKCVIETQTP